MILAFVIGVRVRQKDGSTSPDARGVIVRYEREGFYLVRTDGGRSLIFSEDDLELDN